MEKISVLHIITNLALGGAQKNALYIIKHLDSQKYEKHCISAPWGQLYDGTGRDRGVTFYYLNCLKRRISLLNDLRAFFAIVKYIRQHKISLVHTHSSKAGIIGRWAAKFAKVPVIIHTVHGWSFNDHLPGPLKAFYIFLERHAAKITTFFIAVSDEDIKKGLKNKIGVLSQYKLIRYGIEISEFDKAAAVRPDKDFSTVGMVACFKPQKNPLDFIQAAEIISQNNEKVRFICIGDGPLRAKIERRIEELALKPKIDLLGWRHDVAELLARIDVVALTSLWEGLPIALLEAMAAARPVVAYDTDGVKEAVEDKSTGFIVKQKDISGLAHNIQQLLADRQLAAAMGKQGRSRLLDKGFDARTMMRKIEDLYAAALAF